MRKVMLLAFVVIVACSLVGCGGGGGGSHHDGDNTSVGGNYQVKINLKEPQTQSNQSIKKSYAISKSLSYDKVYTTGKFATYVTCQVGTKFNGGYASNLNQRVGLVVNIADSSGNPIANIDPSQVSWTNPDPQNIYFVDLNTGNDVTTPPNGSATFLDIRKSGKYTVAASYQGNTGTCQVIAYNATYIGRGSAYPPPMPDYQGVIFSSDAVVTQTNNISTADFYIDYDNSDNTNFTIVAPGGVALLSSMESWIQIDAIYLYQFGNLSAVPGGLNFGTTQVTMPINTPQILIIKKRDNSGYVKIALNGGFISPGGNIISMVYAMSSGTSFPLSFD